jgi:alpha-tubulin suppressor-like RCC1 family protein
MSLRTAALVKMAGGGAVLLLLAVSSSAWRTSAVTAIAAGTEHSLALTSEGTGWEWGAALPGLPVAFPAGKNSGAARGTRLCGQWRQDSSPVADEFSLIQNLEEESS